MAMSITVKKRKVMECITMSIQMNLFNEEELDQIMMVCKSAIDRVQGDGDNDD